MTALSGPIVPYPRRKRVDRSDVRLPVAWECFTGESHGLVIAGPWLDPAGAEARDAIRRVVGEPGQPVLFVLSDSAPSVLSGAMLDSTSGNRRVYVLGSVGFGDGPRDPGLRDRTMAFVLVRRTSLPLVSAVVNCTTQVALICVGGLATGAPQWCVRLDNEQSAGFFRVALHWFWHHAKDEAWTAPKVTTLSFQSPQERPRDVVPPTEGAVRLLRRPLDVEAAPGGAVCVWGRSTSLPKGARRLITHPAGEGQEQLREIAATGTEVVSLGAKLPDLWVTPTSGVIEWPMADFILRLRLNATQAGVLYDALLQAKPAAALRYDAPLRTLSGSVWLPGAAGAKPCVEEEEIKVGEVPCESLDEVGSKEPKVWPESPPLVRTSAYTWTNVPPYSPAKATRSSLYRNWEDADQFLASGVKSCGQQLGSAGERSEQAKSALGNLLRGVLGLDRKRTELIAECEELKNVRLAGMAVEDARAFLERLKGLETGVEEYVRGVDSDIAAADEQQQREQWEKDQAEHARRLEAIDDDIVSRKKHRTLVEQELGKGKRGEESESDWKTRQSKLNDELKSVNAAIANLNGSRSEPAQALTRVFNLKSRHSKDLKGKGSRGFVPAPAKGSDGIKIPAEALPKIGELLEAGADRFLAIDQWDQLETGRSEAARLKAKLVARKR